MAQTPFIDPETTELDTGQIYNEALPLLALIVLFGVLGAIPFLFVLFTGGNTFFSILLTFLAQLIFAVGGGIVIIYAVARGIQLSGVVEG